MLQFSAGNFYWIGYALESLKTDCLMKPEGGLGTAPMLPEIFNQPIGEETLGRAADVLARAQQACAEIGMAISAETIADLRKQLDKTKGKYGYQMLFAEIGNVQRLIRREMKVELFLYVSPERAKFWPTRRKPHLFGKEVAQAFPSANFDVAQAGIALATRLATASVFHLMRVLEIGLGAIGAKFGVSLEYRNWGPAIGEIEAKVRAMNTDPVWRTLPDCKEQQEFYSQAISHLGVLKDAWRNYTMHSRGKYTEDEAEQILANVKAFMRRLAQRLSEAQP